MYMNKEKVPISQKMMLTIEEAAEYSNIGINKIRELTHRPMVTFVLHVGNKTLIKRREFEDFIRKQTEI